MTVEIRGKVMGRGEGCTKKEAEQRAAEQALAQLSQRDSDTIRHSLE
jgi:dsRNA-specific ribonuclease